jgi:competence protein ComEA
MEPSAGANLDVRMNPAPVPRHEMTAALSWPVAVQISLVLVATATLFFLMGRLSLGNSNSAPAEAAERAGPSLDLNRATQAELRLVPGLGDSLSQKVVEYRERVGAFRNLDDLRHVHGIGPKTLERIRPHLFIADPPPQRAVMIESGMAPSVVRSVTKGKKESQLTDAINVNRADQVELQKLPGIGPKLSQRILDERAKKQFQSIEDLRRVAGIGPKTLEKIRPYVTIE